MSLWKVILTSVGLGVLLYWGWKNRSNCFIKEKGKLKKRRLSKKDEDNESLVEESSNSILKASEELKTQATDEAGIGDVKNIENKAFYRNISSEDIFNAELEHFHIDIQYRKTRDMKLFLSNLYNSLYGDYYYNSENVSAAATAIKYKNLYAYDLLVSIGSYSNPSITYYTDDYYDEVLLYSIRDIHDKYAKSLVRIHEDSNFFEHDYLKSLYNKCKLSFCTPESQVMKDHSSSIPKIKVIEYSASIAKILKKVSEAHCTFDLALKILDACEGLEIFFDFETKNFRMINPCMSRSHEYNKISIDIKERKIYCFATNEDDERFIYEICQGLEDFATGIVNNVDDHSDIIKNRLVTKIIDFDIFTQQLPLLRLKQNLNENSELFKTLNLIPKDRQYMKNALAGLRPDYRKSYFLMSNHPLLQMYKYFYDIRFKGIFVTIDDLLNDECYKKVVDSYYLISNPYIVIHCISKPAEMLKSIQQKLTESGINRYTFLLNYNRNFAVNIPIQVDSIDEIQFRNESIEKFDALVNKHENDKKKLELQILDIRETLKMQFEQKEHAIKLIEQKETIKDNQYDSFYERTFIHHFNYNDFKISGNKIVSKVKEEKFKAVFISGEAGLGTTTELKILKKQNDENPEWKYTLFLDLKELDDKLICGFYKEYPLRCRNDIINFFCANKIIENDNQELFQYSFNHGLVSFFMDAMDNNSPTTR
ncbi:CLUMA_CG016121, isoform A [Clunio marinus]|uniref:CLUMA_CG016121, isoform A n=1 Tax=Clunio marinus TaxID=568069 RepID=A0A1J1IRS4_9DIPT|nr:CLUMA_CG016121, isoform A [Clunio marinus]